MSTGDHYSIDNCALKIQQVVLGDKEGYDEGFLVRKRGTNKNENKTAGKLFDLNIGIDPDVSLLLDLIKASNAHYITINVFVFLPHNLTYSNIPTLHPTLTHKMMIQIQPVAENCNIHVRRDDNVTQY